MLHVIIPVYNERDNIAGTLHDVETLIHCERDVTIVYDFDEDNTLPAARAFQEQSALRVHFLRNTLGAGVAFAIRAGLGQVHDGAALVVMADSSDDLRTVDAMWEKIQDGYDVVCGSRYMRGGRQIGGPWLKSLLSRLAGLSLYWLTRIQTHDVSNSFKMYSARLLNRIDIESSQGFVVGLEILVKCYTTGGRITELPSIWRDRTAGESRFRLWDWLPYYLKWYFRALAYTWLPGGPNGKN